MKFFLVVPFNEISLFSKDLITFIISFISLFIRVIPELIFLNIFTNHIESSIYKATIPIILI